jgi:uncharacterized phiE125 gp8 family phage protein
MSAVTLLEAKAHLKVLHTEDDVYIQTLVDVAEAQAEEITSRNLLETTNVFYLSDYIGNFTLPKSPLIAVDTIQYVPYGESDYVTLASDMYEVDDSSEPARVRFFEGLYVADLFKAIKVTYRAGYAEVEVPKPIKQWILIRVATLYENREEIIVGTINSVIQNDYNDFLLSKYKVGRL